MKAKNIIFTSDEEKNIFLKRCVLDGETVYKGLLNKLVEEAKDSEDLRRLILTNDELKLSQAYAEVSKVSDGHWYRVRDMLGDRVFITQSEVGALKLGNEEFSILIRNGYGDGETRVAIIDKKNFNDHMMQFSTTIAGKFNIYSHDCGNDVIKTIEGKYFCYYYESMIALVKW